MSLLPAIHQRWANSSALVNLLPAERFFTGIAPPNTPVPYATLQVVQETPETYTALHSYLEQVEVRFEIRGTSLTEGLRLRHQLDATFHQQPLAITDGTVLEVQRCGGKQTQEAHGIWVCQADYRFVIQRSH